MPAAITCRIRDDILADYPRAGVVQGVDFCVVTSSRYYAPVALGIWCANWELGCEALGLQGLVESHPNPVGELAIPRHDVTWVPMGAEGA